MINFKTLFFVGCIIIFNACHRYPEDVRKSLKLAGDNRSELEKVLERYGTKPEDSLKYKAACFLIGNMWIHGSKQEIHLDTGYHNLFLKTDSIFTRFLRGKKGIPKLPKEEKDTVYAFRKINKSLYNRLEAPQIVHRYKSDLHSLNADFLIDNIESAFSVWKESPLLMNMDFNMFKEFILPYRSGEEWIPYHRSWIKEKILPQLEPENWDDIRIPIDHFNYYAKYCRALNRDINKGRLGFYGLFATKYKMECHDKSTWVANIYRSCGIPVVCENTVQWVSHNNRHFWLSAPDSNLILKPFTAMYNNLGTDWGSLKRSGKVYRETFSCQKNSPFFIKGSKEIIPPNLAKPNIMDVTHHYHHTVTLTLPFHVKTGNKLAYLCQFNSKGWNPVAWGKVDTQREQVVFEKVPLNLLLMPALYDGEIKGFGEPFILMPRNHSEIVCLPKMSGDTAHLVVKNINGEFHLTNMADDPVPFGLSYVTFPLNTGKKENMLLHRKFYAKKRLKKYAEVFAGATIKGSNSSYLFDYYPDENNWQGADKLFTNADTLFTFDAVPPRYLKYYKIENPNYYRYYRIVPNNKKSLHIASLEFVINDKKGKKDENSRFLPIFTPSDTIYKNEKFRILQPHKILVNKYEKAFDKNLETFSKSRSFSVDFGKPVKVEGFLLAPRNANNAIQVGHRYLLRYWNNGWKDFGEQVAIFNFLEFKDVPSGTLYWLRDLNYGKEEWPFFYHNGKQVFVNQDDISFLYDLN